MTSIKKQVQQTIRYTVVEMSLNQLRVVLDLVLIFGFSPGKVPDLVLFSPWVYFGFVPGFVLVLSRFTPKFTPDLIQDVSQSQTEICFSDFSSEQDSYSLEQDEQDLNLRDDCVIIKTVKNPTCLQTYCVNNSHLHSLH